MSRRTARVIAITALVLCASSATASVVLRATAPPDPSPATLVLVGDPSADRVAEVRAQEEAAATAEGTRFGEQAAGSTVGVVLLLLACLGWMSVGALIVSKQPRNWAGWTFLVVGAVLPFTMLVQVLVVIGTRRDPGSVPFLNPIAVLGSYLIYLVALLPLLFLLYPDGRVPSPGWRWAVRGLVGGTGLAILGYVLTPGPMNAYISEGVLYVNPTGIDGLGPLAGGIIAVGTIVAIFSALSTVVAIRQRYRRSTGDLREQMRLLVLVAATAGIIFVLSFAVSIVGSLINPDSELPVFYLFFLALVLTLLVGIPGAYLVAIFRHGLWDMGLVIRKTVQYAVVVVAFMLVGFLVVAIVPTVLIGAGGTDYLPTILFGAFLAAIFLWLRPRASRFANRVVYGKRATPYEVLSEFSERVGETYSTDDVLPRMAQLLVQATGAVRADVWLRVGAQLRPEATWPPEAIRPTARPLTEGGLATQDGEYLAEVRHQDSLLGAITLEPAADDPMNASKESLVRDLAAQAGLVLRNVGLIEQLRASRQRLVAAQDEERRKLERNIHDGVQQQLVALTVQLRLAEQLTERDPAKARELMASLQGRTNEALEDLRDLARGIYPPLLADKGLPTALEAQARKSPITVSVHADGVARYPQTVESAVYFSCLEALNNVAKYAEADHVVITLEQTNGTLRFEVTDDGRGFDPDADGTGTGLQGVADRLAAIGGSMQVASTRGSGTTLHGELPVDET